MRETLIRLGIAAAVFVVLLFAFLVYVLLASSSPDYWAGEISEFERQDVSNPPPKGGIVFVGGRDVRLWETLGEDMAPLQVLNRGFGGAYLDHLTYFAARIIKPYRPRAVVVIAGAEDMADVQGRTPEELLEGFKVFLSALRAHEVSAPVIFVSIRPSPMRAARWFGAKRANGLIEAFAAARDDVIYLDVASLMFTADEEMRDEIFRWDGLSLSPEGYSLLTSRLKPLLLRRFDSPQPNPPEEPNGRF